MQLKTLPGAVAHPVMQQRRTSLPMRAITPTYSTFRQVPLQTIPSPQPPQKLAMAQPAIISGFPKLNSSHSLREVRERCGTHLDTRQDVSLFCFADMRKKIRLAASDVEKRNQPKYKHRGERQGLETKEFT
jgi:hypothetical protein